MQELKQDKILSKKLVKICGLNTIYDFSGTWFKVSNGTNFWTL